MKNVLVTQSFGQVNEYRRAIFMIWSFWSHCSTSAKVVLFTDRPDYFGPYFLGKQIEYVMLTPSKIKAMRGSIDFLHRMKIALIEEAFNMTETNLLYADSDTFFTSDPSPLLEKLSPIVALMHTREYAFEEIRNMPLPAGKAFREFVTLLDKQPFDLADGSSLKITTDQSSWNAGVMFFHRSHAPLLQDVYTLTDQFYPPTKNHASEQYAFSIVMQNNTTLHSCEEFIYHYWHRVKKQIMDVFLEKNIQLLVNSNTAQQIALIKKWTHSFPLAFSNHVWILRDQSIQAFHENKFTDGCQFAIRAMLKNPFNFTFMKDIAYHIKRRLLATSSKENSEK